MQNTHRGALPVDIIVAAIIGEAAIRNKVKSRPGKMLEAVLAPTKVFGRGDTLPRS
jgi:hypothetical protein